MSNERASLVPTVMQAGYAVGLLFLCPLGDILRRRAFVLYLIFITATVVRLPTPPTRSSNMLTLAVAWFVFNKIFQCVPGIIFHRRCDDRDTSTHAPTRW